MKRIAVIGAGNVASSLVPALEALDGVSVVQNWTRRSGQPLTPDADVYIMAVSDDAIAPLAERFAGLNSGALWLHTSGSVGMDALAPLGRRHGVFYPLQTFTRGRCLDFGDIPLFIEGSDPSVAGEMKELASRLSHRVYDADSSTRRAMHVAAVFACNFANHLWSVADGLLRERSLSFDILGPLLGETLTKALESSPAEGQTGPARRGDSRVMGEHIASLPPDLAEIYRVISRHIINQYSSNEQDTL